MALDVRRSASLQRQQQESQSQSSSSSSSSMLMSGNSSESEPQANRRQQLQQNPQQQQPLPLPHPLSPHSRSIAYQQQQRQEQAKHQPLPQQHLIVSSSFKSQLDRMSALGQLNCDPVIKRFATGSGANSQSETTSQLLISTDWDLDGPLKCFYNSNQKDDLILGSQRMQAATACKPVALLNGRHNHHSNVSGIPQQFPNAAPENLSTSSSSPSPTFRVLTWNGDWIQCSGHEGVFAPSKEGTIWKKTSASSGTTNPKPFSNNNSKSAKKQNTGKQQQQQQSSTTEENNEIEAYKKLMGESEMREFVPHFYSEILIQGDHFIEIEDLLRHFRPSDSCSSSPPPSSSSIELTASRRMSVKTTTPSSSLLSSSSSSASKATKFPPSLSVAVANKNANNSRDTTTTTSSASSNSNKIYIMDIKMGTRTFLEQEAASPTERSDLYDKMIKVDPLEPTAQEHANKSVTKLRYMSFRESLSSSSLLGFRIEGVQPFPTKEQIGKDLPRVKDEKDIRAVFHHFLNSSGNHSQEENMTQRPCLKQQLVSRLHQLKRAFMKSKFCAEHEVIGSSLLVIHDTEKLGVWMIDFAKSVPLPAGTSVNHVTPWKLGNHEDGYLFGLQNLIRVVDNL